MEDLSLVRLEIAAHIAAEDPEIFEKAVSGTNDLFWFIPKTVAQSVKAEALLGLMEDPLVKFVFSFYSKMVVKA